MLDKINVILLSLLGSKDLVNKWWSSPNKHFKGQTPSQVNLPDVYKYVSSY